MKEARFFRVLVEGNLGFGKNFKDQILMYACDFVGIPDRITLFQPGCENPHWGANVTYDKKDLEEVFEYTEPQYFANMNQTRMLNSMQEKLERDENILKLLRLTQGKNSYIDLDGEYTVAELGSEFGMLFRYEDELYSVDEDVWHAVFKEFCGVL